MLGTVLKWLHRRPRRLKRRVSAKARLALHQHRYVRIAAARNAWLRRQLGLRALALREADAYDDADDALAAARATLRAALDRAAGDQNAAGLLDR